MRGVLFLAVIALGAAPALAAQQAPPVLQPVPQTDMIDLSLIDALTAIAQPQLAGLFSYIPSQNSPFAFADLLIHDKGDMKRYLAKLATDRKAANALTPWDHQVCAVLTNLYDTPMGAALERLDKKQMTAIHECVLSPIIALQDLVQRRKK